MKDPNRTFIMDSGLNRIHFGEGIKFCNDEIELDIPFVEKVLQNNPGYMGPTGPSGKDGLNGFDGNDGMDGKNTTNIDLINSIRDMTIELSNISNELNKAKQELDNINVSLNKPQPILPNIREVRQLTFGTWAKH